MNIYVGNLSFDASEEDLQKLFSGFGQVGSVTIVRDKYSGQPRGFGFIDMPERSEAQAAIENLNGKELLGRSINVSEARPRADRGKPGGQGGRKGGRPGGHGGGRNRY